MDRSYDGAVVVVTGASTGLGRAIAVGAATRGARAVVINFASSAAEAEITAGLVREAGAEAVLAQGDVGQDEVCRAVAEAAAPYGRIDALFNNAGITRARPYGDLDALTGEDFLDIYRVNVVGPYQMIRAARALLEGSDRAAVVNTSSIAGVTGGGSSIAYSASKGALNTMTRSLAYALAPKIRVNTICPGFIESPWFDKLGMDAAAMGEHIRQTNPLKVVSSPEDVAEGALFFGSRASRHTTGETLLIDAGLHLGKMP
ncbi:MAG: SDR family oxidoreductase [Sphingomonadales bacterium]|nr:SDR family oxidoreductase [Sphingomonadales bacterium]